MRVTSVTFTVRAVRSTTPGPPRVTSASVVTVTPLASTPTPAPAVVAIVSVGPYKTEKC